MPSLSADATALVAVEDVHFAWMLGEAPAPSPALRMPPGGVDVPEILRIVRRMTRRVHKAGARGNWLIVCGGEVVGLAGYKQAPDPDGVVEIGYGVAVSRRNRGHATRAVTAMLAHARADPKVTTVRAETAVANFASQRALERNGFSQYGTGNDPDDGPMILWKIDLAAT